MLFNSYDFLVFFLVVTTIYFLLPHKFRWFHLLVASCYFYMAFVPIYILILFFTIIVDYIAGLMIEKADGPRRRWYLIMSVVANVGILAVFKYYNFFIENVNVLFHTAHSTVSIPLLKIILPIGLSFHTFQAMSYTIEVYRGNQKAERHFGIYALYVMFYPQLVAGPIERPQNVLYQFHEKHKFDYDNVTGGLRQVLWGLFKKAVIADRLSLFVSPIFSNPHNYSAIGIFTAMVFFGFQIYCDFSGYSDIALGTARVMGYKLMVNFDMPFRSKSITEFWRRWHISLSTWFNDYLFNPIVTGLRYWGKWGIAIALIITFFLSGLWHGAAWKFVVFGLIHGIALVYEFLTKKKRKKIFSKLPVKLNNVISNLLTIFYVMLSWLFFRANNVADAVYMLKQIPSFITELLQVIANRKLLVRKFLPNISLFSIEICIFRILILEGVQYLQKNRPIDIFIGDQLKVVRWAIYLVTALCIFLYGVFDNQQFIYFQF